MAAVSGADTILVVDDEEMVRGVAKAALEKYGYQVVLAEDGPQALEVFRRMGNEIALVLLDMTMPVMSGEQTFAEMCKLRPDLLAVASSGYSEAEAMARFGTGISGFVQKPYSAAHLAAKIAEALGGRRRMGSGAGSV
jgi:CheY-like chemotaxis protein